MSDTVNRKCARCRGDVRATLTVTTRSVMYGEIVENTFNMCGAHVTDLAQDATTIASMDAGYGCVIGPVTEDSPHDFVIRFLDLFSHKVLDEVNVHDELLESLRDES